jgi:uncharacterized membrane protein YdjX (TVP38/TMEM64 family)
MSRIIEGTAAAPDTRDGAPHAPSAAKRSWYDLGFSFTPRTAWILLGLLALGVVVSYGLDLAVSRVVDIEAERVGRWVNGLGPLAPVAFVLIEAGTVVFTPVPSVPVDIAGGLAFGMMPGTLYVLGGAMIGATVDFYLARWLGRGFVERKLGGRVMEQIDTIAVQMGMKVIFVTRLIPLFNFKWVSYAAGLTRISYRTYATGSVLGTLLPTIGIVYVGDVLLTHPGRSALVFTALVVWSAVPPVAFLLAAGARALHRRLRGGRPGLEAEAAE